MRSIRTVEPGGQFFELTTRTIHGRLLLRPSKRVNETILGILARALERHPEVRLCAFVFLSNHYHLVAWALNQEAESTFMEYLNGLIARKIGRLHDWRDRLWSRRFEDIAILDDDAVIDRIRYVLGQGVKEGLVASPYQWPGATCVRALTRGARLLGSWDDETRRYEARKAGRNAPRDSFRTQHEIELMAPPMWSSIDERERQKRFRKIVKEIEKEGRKRNKELHREPMGPRWVLRQHPHTRPRAMKRTRAPWCHTKSRELRVEYCARQALRTAIYRELSARIREGDFAAITVLPDGCHPPPLHGSARDQFSVWRARQV